MRVEGLGGCGVGGRPSEEELGERAVCEMVVVGRIDPFFCGPAPQLPGGTAIAPGCMRPPDMPAEVPHFWQAPLQGMGSHGHPATGRCGLAAARGCDFSDSGIAVMRGPNFDHEYPDTGFCLWCSLSAGK